jgi:protein-disulfide isomerase/uncharacterized membrane protein
MNNDSKKTGFAARILPLLILAFLTSLYLLHHDLQISSGTQIGPSICTLSDVFDCDAVSKSEYSKFLGFPIAMYGSMFYGMLLLLTFFYRKKDDSVRLRSSMLFFSFISLFPSLYLGYASYFIIEKVCIFCAFLYVLNIFLFLLTFFLGKNDGSFIRRSGQGVMAVLSMYFFRRGVAFPISLVGLIIFIFFGQVVYITKVLEPRFFSLMNTEAMEELVAVWDGETEHTIFHRVDTLPGVIVLGRADAPFTLVEFSDYECPMCQKMAPVVADIFEELGDQLKIVLLSFPLHSFCNRTVGPFHPHACQLSKLVICAALEDQERAYELHEAILHAGISSEESYQDFIKEENLDEMSCFSQDRVLESLESQIELGVIGELKGTPSFYLNGKRVHYGNMWQLKNLIKSIMDHESRKKAS